MVYVHWRSLYTDGPYAGGPCLQMVYVHGWSLYTDGLCTLVVHVH